MGKYESLLFVALFFGVPVAMAGALVWQFVRWWGDRTRVAEAKRAGWNALDEASVLWILDACAIPTDRAHLLDSLESDGLIVTKYGRRHRGSSEQRMNLSRRMLIGRRNRGGVEGVLQPRQGGILETAAMAWAGAVAVKPRELEGWEWAWVSAAGPTWLSPIASEPLRACLAPQERLHLGPEHWILSLPPGPLAPLIEEARMRADVLDEALKYEKPVVDV